MEPNVTGKEIKKLQPVKLAAVALIALLGSLAVYCFVIAVGSSSFSAILKAEYQRPLVFVLIAAFFLVAALLFVFKRKSAARFLFRYRWLLAIVLFVLCVVFEISGSSIGITIDFMGADDGVILGSSRTVRSDEWLVFTPMAISQCTTDGGIFSYFQDSFRGVETDMFCVYGQPVWNIAEVFRPFQWGYLFLGASKGLAFFWCGRLIFLFMVSFEFSYLIITEKREALSVCYALLIAFASSVQWWFAINCLVEMILFGQLALIFALYYLKTDSYKVRFLYSIGIAWCLGVYLLAFYPAWQVPFAYVFLGLLVALLVERLPNSRKSVIDLLNILFILVVVGLTAYYIFVFKSWETIRTVLDTVYPGERSATGGGGLQLLFQYPLTLVAAIDPDYIWPSASEGSAFFTLFPLCIVLPAVSMFAIKRIDFFAVPLLVVSLFLLWFIVLGMPSELAHVSLLDKSQTTRVVNAFEFLAIILLIRSIGYGGLNRGFAVCTAGLLTLVYVPTIYYMFAMYGISLRSVFVAVFTLVVFASVAFSLIKAKQAFFVVGCLIVALLGGSLVNPVRGGIEGYFDNDLSKTIDSVAQPEDLWATVGTSLESNNITASLGHRSLNSVNTYPQIETWRKLDPAGEYEDIYNRYAHVIVILKPEGNAGFVLNQTDVFTVDLTPDDLRKLGVTKLLCTDFELDDQYDDLGVELVAQTEQGWLYELGRMDNE